MRSRASGERLRRPELPRKELAPDVPRRRLRSTSSLSICSLIPTARRNCAALRFCNVIYLPLKAFTLYVKGAGQNFCLSRSLPTIRAFSKLSERQTGAGTNQQFQIFYNIVRVFYKAN